MFLPFFSVENSAISPQVATESDPAHREGIAQDTEDKYNNFDLNNFEDCVSDFETGVDLGHRISEFKEGDSQSNVYDRLRQNIHFWKETLTCPRFVLDTVEFGYKIPFKHSKPTPCFLRNNKSALKHPEFVKSSILKLLSDGKIEEHSSPPFCVNPLTVAEGKKLRLVLDLRHVNNFVYQQKFQYENLNSLSEVFEKDFWFFTWDLKSGYHHVNIFEPHQKYLGFSWVIDGKLRYFTFKVLPFGLSTACFCFTKTLRPFCTKWRSAGHNCFIYIDDGISGHESKTLAIEASRTQKSDLTSAGFLFSEKCQWEPTQIGEWLGLVINTLRFEFCIPERKMKKLLDRIERVIFSRSATYKEIAKIAGFLQSLTLAIGPVCRLFSRQMYLAIANRTFWDCHFALSPELIEELRFWVTNLCVFNAYTIRPKLSFDYAIYTDASDHAFGGYSNHPSFHPVRGILTFQEKEESSTYRELVAIDNTMSVYAPTLSHSKIKFFSDNKGACSILKKGSPKIILNDLAISIFSKALRNDISFDSQWIPRTENERADFLSKYEDKDDWKIHPKVFRYIDLLWGPHSVDRFSSHYNNQVNRFNSRFASPGCEGVDALAQNWSSDNNWVCPPPAMIVPVIHHFKNCKASGTLIIPEWPSAYFWPVIHPSRLSFASFVTDVYVLPKIKNLIISGPGQVHVYKKRKSVFTGCPSFNMLALKINFRRTTTIISFSS